MVRLCSQISRQEEASEDHILVAVFDLMSSTTYHFYATQKNWGREFTLLIGSGFESVEEEIPLQ